MAMKYNGCHFENSAARTARALSDFDMKKMTKFAQNTTVEAARKTVKMEPAMLVLGPTLLDMHSARNTLFNEA
jgi:hypothetical protein